jgi:hypothetical protein
MGYMLNTILMQARSGILMLTVLQSDDLVQRTYGYMRCQVSNRSRSTSPCWHSYSLDYTQYQLPVYATRHGTLERVVRDCELVAATQYDKSERNWNTHHCPINR